MLKTASFELVEAGIKRVEARMREGIDGHHESLATTIDYLVAAGGKRLRPVIVLLATRFCSDVRSDADKVKAISLAAAAINSRKATATQKRAV